MRSDEVQSISLSLIMENCLPFTDDVMVVLVHKCVQQTHLLALYFEPLGYILRLLNALNGQRAGFFIFAVVIVCLKSKLYLEILHCIGYWIQTKY